MTQQSLFLQTVLNGLMLGFVLSLVASSLSLIWGVMGVVNFAHGDFMMLSMYISYWAFSLVHIDPMVSLLLSAGLLFLLGMLLHGTIFVRVQDAPMIVQVLATSGLAMFMRGSAQYLFSPLYRLIQVSWISGQLTLFGGLRVGKPQLVSGLGAILVTVFFFWLIEKTETGRALRAVAEDRAVASLVGIDSQRMNALALAIGLACVGVAGGLISTYYYVFPNVGIMFGTLGLVIVGMAGFGNIRGSFTAGIGAGLVMALSGYYISSTYKTVTVFLLYLVVVQVRALLARRALAR